MLEYVYRNKSTIEMLRNGPLGSYPDELAQYYLDSGYTSQYLKTRFGSISQFNKLLIKNKTLKNIDRKLIDQFIALQIETKKCFVRSGANFLFKHLIGLLIRDGKIKAIVNKPPFGSDGINTLLLEYQEYLSKEKGLASSSIARFGKLAQNAIQYSKASTLLKLSRLDANDIHGYIMSRGKIYSTKHVQLIASCLRCFLKYLLRKGIVKTDLSACIPTLSSYRAAHLPEYLEPDQLTKLLQSCNRETATGSRNYAVLSLLAHIGLRASEVIQLTLDDINWRAGEFTIKGKGGNRSTMPLPNVVGEAIADYVIHFRAKVKKPHIFLNTRAPFQQFNNPSTVSSIVRRQLHLAHIETTSKGAHLLRYTAATNCLRNGGSLYEACELLRHFSIDTTATYAKVDHERLSQLAMPWPSIQEASYA